MAQLPPKDNIKTSQPQCPLLARKDDPAPEADATARTRSDGKRPRRERSFAGRRYILGTIHPASDELQELAETLGMRQILEAYQPRARPHPGTFFGKGRLTTLRAGLDEWRAGIVPIGWMTDGDRWTSINEGDPFDVDDDLSDDAGPETSDRPTADSASPSDAQAKPVAPSDATAWHGTPRARHGRPGGAEHPAADSRGDHLRQATSKPGGDETEATRDAPDTPKSRSRGDPLSAHEVGSAGWRAAAVGHTALEPDAKADAAQETNETEVPPIDTEEFADEDDADYAFESLDLQGGSIAPPPYPDDLLLILDEDVRPSVLFNLEERLKVEVWDRTRLILEIFTQHAHVKEARLQVELAKLQYEIPLIHEAVHRRRSGERPGFRGGGDYGVADYEDFIKRRMRSVKDELARIQTERGVRRKVRRERFYLLSLAGYTNAGKSSLLNAMTDAGSLSEGTLFSTLETTTRKLTRASPKAYERPILLTDTVGFIQALPSWLLDAFHSTLEEIGVSDVVLLVADVSDSVEVLLDKVTICRSELSFLDVTCPVLLVLNKADLVPDAAVRAKLVRLEQAGLARSDQTLIVSSLTGNGVAELLDAIDANLPAMIPYQAEVPGGDSGQRFVSLAYERGTVDAVDYGTRIQLDGSCDPLHWKELVKEANRMNAIVRRIARR